MDNSVELMNASSCSPKKFTKPSDTGIVVLCVVKPLQIIRITSRFYSEDQNGLF